MLAMQTMQTQPTQSLHDIIVAAGSGDMDAFALLVQRFQKMAYVLAYSSLIDRSLAEDVVQEAFTEAYLALPSLREPDAFPSWFKRIVLRQVDRVLRRKQFSIVSLEATPAFDIVEDTDPSLLVETHELQERVRQAIATLPPHEQTTLYLFYNMGYPYKEIAELLNLPVSTVKKRLFDARQHLRGKLHYTMDAVRETLHNTQYSSEQQSPYLSAQIRLLIAVRLNDIEAVRALLEHNLMLLNDRIQFRKTLPLTMLRSVGHTALHEAATHGHLVLAQLLLDYGANVNARTTIGITSLHEAVYHNHPAIVELLLTHSANVNASLDNGLTPLQWAAMQNRYACAEILLRYHADVNVQTQAGRTALDWAMLKGHRELIELFIEYGAIQRGNRV